MIGLSATAQDVLASSGIDYRCAVESWLGPRLLAASVPVEAAGEETDRSLRVPERAVFTVPRIADGFNWSPNADDHPLAANGQRLIVKLGIGVGAGRVEWFTRMPYLIQDAQVDGDRVNVSGVGLLALIDEARLVSPFQPSGTLVSTLRGLLEPALTILVDGTLGDRAVPAGINYDEDRLGAVLELLDAWPAMAAIDPQGHLAIGPAVLPTVPVLDLTDGRGGTVITAAGSSTRDGAVNAVVARGTQADGAQIQGVAYLTGGPKSYGGPFNPLPVPEFFSSPLLTTVDQCNAAAATIVARKGRENAREFRVEMVPHPGVQAGDLVTLTSGDLNLSQAPCTVEALSLPYAAPPGQMPTMALTCRLVVS